MTQGTTKEEPKQLIAYGAQMLAVKEKSFVRGEMEEQLRTGHVTTFHLEMVKYMTGLYISPLVAIPQTGHKNRLIYDFSWSILNVRAN